MKRLFLTLAAVGAIFLAGTAQATATQHAKVGICHRTASDSNPYVYIEVAQAAVKAHIGPNAHPPKSGRYDYFASDASQCIQEVTPSTAPTAEPSTEPSPEPSASSVPSAEPTTEPTPTASTRPSPSQGPKESNGPGETPIPTNSPDVTPTPAPSATPTVALPTAPSTDAETPTSEGHPSPIILILFAALAGGTAWTLRHKPERRR